MTRHQLVRDMEAKDGETVIYTLVLRERNRMECFPRWSLLVNELITEDDETVPENDILGCYFTILDICGNIIRSGECLDEALLDAKFELEARAA